MEGNIHPNHGSVAPGQSLCEKKVSKGLKFFVSFNGITYFLKADVLGYQQTSWAVSDRMSWRGGSSANTRQDTVMYVVTVKTLLVKEPLCPQVKRVQV